MVGASHRIRFGWASRTAACAILCSGSAFSQVDAERMRPAVTYDGFVTAEGSAVRPTSDPFEFGLYLNYAVRPLVVADDDGDYVQGLVRRRVGADLLGSMTLVGPLSLGLGLPAYLLQGGENDPSSAGLGKARVVPKLRLLDDRDSLGLAVAAELRVPTHTGDYSGADGFEFIPKAILDHRFKSGVRVGFNLGVAFKPDSQYLNVNTGHELAYAAAIGYRFGGNQGKTEIGAELVGGLGLVQTNREEAPLELLGYVKQALGDQWEFIGGPGVGVLPGYGVPIFRVFAGIRFAPTSHDRDHDGIDDDHDACPDVAEDRDADRDADGCPEEDLDTDRDGVPDDDDLCPSARETINGIDDDDGCPDTGDPRVVYEDGKFVVLDAIHFETGKADIQSDSHPLLNQVAQMIKANPDLRIRVEGHTDDTGPRDTNMRLSQARAAAVRRYLVSRGVVPQRMRSVGHGPDRPIIKDTTPEARAKNRRVEFVVDE